MKAMIKKDLLMIKGNMKTIIACLLLYILYSIMFEMDMSFIFPFMAMIICISTFSYDDFNNWHLYAITLPNGRKNVVVAKYISSLLLIVITTIISIVLSIFIESIKGSIDIYETLEYLLGMLSSIIIVISLLFPFLIKYGSEKGRVATMLSGIVIIGIYLLLSNIININIINDIILLLDNYLGLILTVVSIIAFIVSYKISLRLYFNREF